MKFRLGPSLTYVKMPTRIRLWLNYHTDKNGKTASAGAKDVYWEIYHVLALPFSLDEVWISNERLQLMCNLKERSVQRAIAWLVNEGALVRHERVGFGVVYELAPATIMSDDYQAMRASKSAAYPDGFCPCAWKGRCRRHPSKVTGAK